MSTRIVTAAAGARDQYQIPLALQEVGLLARHITDQYSPDALLALLDHAPGLLPPQLQAKLRKRHRAGLPSAQVHCSLSVALQLAASHLLRPLLPSLHQRLRNDQDPIGRSALAAARRNDAALLLYAGYAHSAFTAEPRAARRRCLVQYHPHITRSAEILRQDIARFPFLSESLAQLSEDERDPTNLVELELADVVLCCSSFTAATCQAVGVPAAKLRVIAYGIDLDMPEKGAASFESIPAPASSKPCRFLFVGTGMHRKGLHHLLLAWRRAALRHSELWIVSRRVDPQIRQHFDPGDNVRWRHDVSDQELETIYASTPVFLLPSLIEGFGYVYLEALARGCYCIGTANTALPDLLRGSSGCGAVVEAGAIDALADALIEAEARYQAGLLDRIAIASQARHFPWSRFRREVVALARQELLP